MPKGRKVGMVGKVSPLPFPPSCDTMILMDQRHLSGTVGRAELPRQCPPPVLNGEILQRGLCLPDPSTAGAQFHHL